MSAIASPIGQISRGVSAADFAVLLAVGLAALVAAAVIFGRADLS